MARPLWFLVAQPIQEFSLLAAPLYFRRQPPAQTIVQVMMPAVTSLGCRGRAG